SLRICDRIRRSCESTIESAEDQWLSANLRSNRSIFPLWSRSRERRSVGGGKWTGSPRALKRDQINSRRVNNNQKASSRSEFHNASEACETHRAMLTFENGIVRPLRTSITATHSRRGPHGSTHSRRGPHRAVNTGGACPWRRGRKTKLPSR